MIQKMRWLVRVLIVIILLTALSIGSALGSLLASSKNIYALEEMWIDNQTSPVQDSDGKSQRITAHSGNGQKPLVDFNQLPQHLIHALLTREDRNFYKHHGFSIASMISAARDIVTGRSFRGGSTLTQQLAGYLYTDRAEISLKRKLVELWWAVQLESRLTKNEIIEQYLNLMYFGHNTFGIEAASMFFFKHSAEELTPAESVMLVIQLANPRHYSPINHPERAGRMQLEILNQMVELKYLRREEAESSFRDYWTHYVYN